MWIHRIIGSSIVGLTIWGSLHVLLAFPLFNATHVYIAFVPLLACTFVGLLGMIARFLKTSQSMRWNTRQALVVTYVHKSFAYMVMFTAFIAIWTGLRDYRSNSKRPCINDVPLELFNAIVIISIVLIAEIAL